MSTERGGSGGEERIDMTRDQRNRLAAALDSAIRREWPKLRQMTWPDATLTNAITRTLDREDPPVIAGPLSRTNGGIA